MALWSYQGQPVLNEVNSVVGGVAEDFFRRLYEVLQWPRNAPRVMLTKNRPAEGSGEGARMSRYVLRAGWQDQDPWPSGAHWELGWDDERVTFWARLYEDYSPAEPADELLPSDYEPISSHGDQPGSLLDIDELTTLMEEDLPDDLIAKLEADRDRFLATIDQAELPKLAKRLTASQGGGGGRGPRSVGRRGVRGSPRLGLTESWSLKSQKAADTAI